METNEYKPLWQVILDITYDYLLGDEEPNDPLLQLREAVVQVLPALPLGSSFARVVPDFGDAEDSPFLERGGELDAPATYRPEFAYLAHSMLTGGLVKRIEVADDDYSVVVYEHKGKSQALVELWYADSNFGTPAYLVLFEFQQTPT